MNIEQTPEQLRRVREHADKTIRDTFAPVVDNPGSPLSDLLGQVSAAVVSNRRDDPYGEFADVVPVTIRNAGLLLREATKQVVAAKLAHKNAVDAMQETNRALNAAIELERKAEHRLKVSALQPNGGEE